MYMEKNTINQTLLKLLAAVGLVVVLAAMAWGGVKALSYAPQAARAVAQAIVGIQSRLFADEEIVLSTDTEGATVFHDEAFTLSFEHRDKREEGSYRFFYECRDGIHFEVLPAVGREEVAFCNTYFNFVNANNELTLVPFSTAERTTNIPVTIVFSENGSNEVDQVGSLILTIVNNTIAGDTTADTDTTDGGTIIVDNTDNNANGGGGTNTNTGGTDLTPGDKTDTTVQFGTTTTDRFSDPNGKPDLKVTILETGTISRVTGEFTATSTIQSNKRAAIKFEIQNVGTKKISDWRFNSVLPTSPRYIYNSERQPELYPGDKIEFVLGFDSIIKTENAGAKVTVNADPTGSFYELNEDNNIRSVILKVTND